MSDLAKLIGVQLKKIRNAKGLTQEQVAERTGQIGYSKTQISRIEKGRQNFEIETLERIMRALDISPNELFNFYEPYLPENTEDKKLMVNLHSTMLMERDLAEVNYVIRTTKDFLETIEIAQKKQNEKGNY